MSKDTARQISVILTTIITIIMNILANALPLNGQNTGEISDRFKVLFVPAGYVFSIWLIIYIGMIAYTVFQALPAQKTSPSMRRTGWLFSLSGVANTLWLFFWHYNLFPLTLVAMLSLLGLLVTIYLRLGIGRRSAPTAERWSTQIPISVYLGWISVATIANMQDVLYDLGWNGGSILPEVWAVILLAAVVAISAAMLFLRSDIGYAAVIVWAAIGIAVKQAGVPLVATAAWVTMLLVVLLGIATILRPILRKQTASASY